MRIYLGSEQLEEAPPPEHPNIEVKPTAGTLAPWPCRLGQRSQSCVSIAQVSVFFPVATCYVSLSLSIYIYNIYIYIHGNTQHILINRSRLDIRRHIICVNIYIYTRTHTHTHTHIIYIYSVCVCPCKWIDSWIDRPSLLPNIATSQQWVGPLARLRSFFSQGFGTKCCLLNGCDGH